MRTALAFFACALLSVGTGLAAPKQHSVALGKWTTVKWQAGDDESSTVNVKTRPLYVDGRTKEFTLGPTHDVTERSFVVQRMSRLNDSLPSETGPTRWRWERGGWLLVDRITGKLQPVTLPEFDPYYSVVNWFRDYAAYCGVSDDGSKLSAMIVQLGRRKPLLKKTLGDSASACPAPVWQRSPVRVTFQPTGDQRLTFSVKSRAVDVALEDENEGEE